MLSEHTKDSLKQQTSNSIDLCDKLRQMIEDDRDSFSDVKWPEYDEFLEKILLKLEQLKTELENI